MRSILEELFYGNVCPNTDCRNQDKETKELIKYLSDHYSTLNILHGSRKRCRYRS